MSDTANAQRDSCDGAANAVPYTAVPKQLSGQEEVEPLVERASRRILHFLQRQGVITLVTAPGDGEVTVVTDETLGETDSLLAPDAEPQAKGKLCATSH